ncbi:hypothetical protein [Janthinobacterium sp. PAMC25594]|uniref:hypothetical protein n=1 Tax=Janthinobacterium sp. PAMC25594 TaxID=2861284 RepID=UPI002158B3BF|nr:hypothetical protein [Janthinobacterium sp. PAMC25594]
MPPATEQISRLGTARPLATVSARDTVGASVDRKMAIHAIHRTMLALPLLMNMATLYQGKPPAHRAQVKASYKSTFIDSLMARGAPDASRVPAPAQ